jgi:hypothetical protein
LPKSSKFATPAPSPAPTSLQGTRDSTGNKSLFASFSSEKEESSFFEEKEAKKLLSLVVSSPASDWC